MTPGIRSVISAIGSAILIALITATPAMAADWPQFGFGPGHTGTNPHETDLGSPEVAHLALGYRIATRAPASQPIVVNGIGYASVGNHILAFDATTGAVTWRRPTCADAAWPFDVPAYAGGNLWLMHPDSTGVNVLTTMDAATGATTCRTYPGGGAASVTVTRGMVYVAYESDNGSQGPAGAIDAIRATTGTVVWTMRLVGTWLNQPAIANGKIFETTQGGLCYRLDAGTGHIDWVRYVDADIRGATVSDGGVFVTGEFGIDTTTWALSAKTGRTRWTSQAVISATGLLVVDRGRVIASKYDTPQVVALDRSDGSKLWGEFGSGEASGQLTAAGGLIYQIAESGQIVVRRERNGRIVATIGDPDTFSSQTAVTVVNGELLASTGGAAEPGIEMWHVAA
jgi:outer membrane protein assembly factor BamB